MVKPQKPHTHKSHRNHKARLENKTKTPKKNENNSPLNFCAAHKRGWVIRLICSIYSQHRGYDGITADNMIETPRKTPRCHVNCRGLGSPQCFSDVLRLSPCTVLIPWDEKPNQKTTQTSKETHTQTPIKPYNNPWSNTYYIYIYIVICIYI